EPPRFDAMCPGCGSLERHRLIQLWLDTKAETLRGRSILHFAPEPGLAAHLRTRARYYVSADLDPRRAQLRIDVQDIAFPDATFDLLI
ncbi:hypothetical protein J8J27_29755, partial [Mycobacterium tuberculosis]|nr:hypothetical protein [Mycobacterium tuberculosis]